MESYRHFNLFLIIIFILVHCTSCAKCPKDWISPPGDTSCYKFNEEHLTWYEANKYCRAYGGHLLVINSRKEQQWVHSTASRLSWNSWWVGLKRDDNGTWFWTEGIEFDNTITKWAPGEPVDKIFSEDCATFGAGESEGISDSYCKIVVEFICEAYLKNSSTCPDYWLKRSNSASCYLMGLLYLMSWYDAHRFCQEKNAGLVIINSIEEKEWLKVTMEDFGYERIWIGLNDKEEEGVWRWTDGTRLDTNILSWREGYPKGRRSGPDFVVLSDEGHYICLANFFQVNSICEITGEPYKVACTAPPPPSDTQEVRCHSPDGGAMVRCHDVLHVRGSAAVYRCEEPYQSTTGMPLTYSVCGEGQRWSSIHAFQCQ